MKKTIKDKNEFETDPFYLEIMEAIADNINTPKVLASLQGALHIGGENVYAIISWLEENLLKLGLFETILEENFDIPAEVTSLADQRVEAKKNKDYALADELRNKITELGFQVKDTKDGYEISKT